MIITWIIGLILSFLAIWLLKGSRKTKNYYGQKGEPVLKVWSLILYVLGGLIPIFNILMAIIVIVYWAISVYGDGNWEYTRNAWFVSFLTKPIQ